VWCKQNLESVKNVEYEMVQGVCRYQPDRTRPGKGLKTGEVSAAQATDEGMRQTKEMIQSVGVRPVGSCGPSLSILSIAAVGVPWFDMDNYGLTAELACHNKWFQGRRDRFVWLQLPKDKGSQFG
jgi:hypothetical protein